MTFITFLRLRPSCRFRSKNWIESSFILLPSACISFLPRNGRKTQRSGRSPAIALRSLFRSAPTRKPNLSPFSPHGDPLPARRLLCLIRHRIEVNSSGCVLSPCPVCVWATQRDPVGRIRNEFHGLAPNWPRRSTETP